MCARTAKLYEKGIKEIGDDGDHVDVRKDNKAEAGGDDIAKELRDAEEKQLNDENYILDYEVPEKEEEVPLGFSMVKPVNGHFCGVCRKFFSEGVSHHCKSGTHYDKFVDMIEKKKRKITDKLSAGGCLDE